MPCVCVRRRCCRVCVVAKEVADRYLELFGKPLVSGRLFAIDGDVDVIHGMNCSLRLQPIRALAVTSHHRRRRLNRLDRQLMRQRKALEAICCTQRLCFRQNTISDRPRTPRRRRSVVICAGREGTNGPLLGRSSNHISRVRPGRGALDRRENYRPSSGLWSGAILEKSRPSGSGRLLIASIVGETPDDAAL